MRLRLRTCWQAVRCFAVDPFGVCCGPEFPTVAALASELDNSPLTSTSAGERAEECFIVRFLILFFINECFASLLTKKPAGLKKPFLSTPGAKTLVSPSPEPLDARQPQCWQLLTNLVAGGAC